MVTSQRKRKDEQRKERTRQVLLEAGTRVFTSKGYHGTLISDIVSDAGVGQGTFYRNFSSKREIFENILDEFIEKLLVSFTDMTMNLPGDEQQYEVASVGAIRGMAEIIRSHRALILLFIQEAPSIDREFQEKMNDIFEQFAHLAQFYLEYAIAEGFARKCNAALVSQAIVGMGLHLITLWLHNRLGESTIEEIISEIVGFAFKGFGPERDN